MTSPVTLEMQQGLLDGGAGGGGGSSKIAMTSPVTAEMGPGEAGLAWHPEHCSNALSASGWAERSAVHVLMRLSVC